MKTKNLILVIIIVVIILFLFSPYLFSTRESFSPKYFNSQLISESNSPCLLNNQTTLPPVPIDPQIPISSSNSDECLNDFSLSHFSSCFNDKIKVGIPINKQCRAIDSISGSIQIVNGSNMTRWIFWSVLENKNCQFQKTWINRLSTNNIPFSTWRKKQLHLMGIFQLNPKQCILLPYLGTEVKLIPVSDCPDNLSYDNLINGEEFLNHCWITTCGLSMPQTIIEWTYSSNKKNPIKVSVVNGFSRPCKIEYKDNQGQFKTVKMGQYSKPGCIDCKGKTFPTRSGLINSCHLPCSDKNIDSNKLNSETYCSTNICNNYDKCSSNWCAGLRKFYSLNTENLGYCYGYKQESKTIIDYQFNEIRIKLTFC